MATNTFERKIEINDLESMKKLNDIVNADALKFLFLSIHFPL